MRDDISRKVPIGQGIHQTQTPHRWVCADCDYETDYNVRRIRICPRCGSDEIQAQKIDTGSSLENEEERQEG